VNALSTSPTQVEISGPRGILALEFKTFAYPFYGDKGRELPPAPGAARRDDMGRATLLHFAPGRFLAPKPGLLIARYFETLAAAGVGVAFDVEGKWSNITLVGDSAQRLLSATIDTTEVLAHRECAAVRLFDCPSVLACQGRRDFEVWVEASYAEDLRRSFERVARHLSQHDDARVR
jgi:sarcosine oxidase gamma subunit